MNPLLDAIRSGDGAQVAALLDADPSLLGQRENGVTPVLFALYHGRQEIAQQLAARAPLSFAEACAMGDEVRVEELLASDPSLLASRSDDGFPAFSLAIFFGRGKLARRLIERGADVNAAASNPMRVAPVHAAAAVHDLETMRVLLARGADPDARQQMDYTPLHEAARAGDLVLARLLVEHGADPRARTAEGETAMDIARKNGREEMVGWLGGF